MLFNSYEFLFLFLPITMMIFYAFCRYQMLRAATWWIGVASLFFYAYWDWKFLILFVVSILFNYGVGNHIIRRAGTPSQRRLLIFGLTVNLGLLGFFKYSQFFLQNITALTHVEWSLPAIILPIGISFFTFTQIAYLVDCARNKCVHYQFSDYLLFVSFFPHLVAGPILRHEAIIPQLESRKFGQPSSKKIYMAVIFFSIGLFKKIVIADNLALYVDPLFANIHQLSTVDAWFAAIFYTFQIYFDFSAYSEMAIGLGLLMNVRLPFNFNSPYKASSIVDFWRRWHISLSGFLRDYLYISLGGNRKGNARRYINLFTTMLLGGLWHGAAWTFVIWGALHGCYLIVNHAWHKTGIKLPYPVAWAMTFLAVMFAWVFFRAENITSAFTFIQAMSGRGGVVNHGEMTSGLLMAAMLMIMWTLTAPNTQQVAFSRKPRKLIAVQTAVMLLIGILGLGHSDHFIYFQF